VILLAFRQGRRRRLPCQMPRHCPKTPKDRSGVRRGRFARPRTRQTWLCACGATLLPLVSRCQTGVCLQMDSHPFGGTPFYYEVSWKEDILLKARLTNPVRSGDTASKAPPQWFRKPF
jgi:hypothetical protein